MRSKYINWLVLTICLVQTDGSKVLVAVTPRCTFLLHRHALSMLYLHLSIESRTASTQASYENPFTAQYMTPSYFKAAAM